MTATVSGAAARRRVTAATCSSVASTSGRSASSFTVTRRRKASRGLGWEGKEFSEAEIDTVRNWAMSYAMTIAGGTSEIQLNVIAKNVLQLPQ